MLNRPFFYMGKMKGWNVFCSGRSWRPGRIRIFHLPWIYPHPAPGVFHFLKHRLFHQSHKLTPMMKKVAQSMTKKILHSPFPLRVQRGKEKRQELLHIDRIRSFPWDMKHSEENSWSIKGRIWRVLRSIKIITPAPVSAHPMAAFAPWSIIPTHPSINNGLRVSSPRARTKQRQQSSHHTDSCRCRRWKRPDTANGSWLASAWLKSSAVGRLSKCLNGCRCLNFIPVNYS